MRDPLPTATDTTEVLDQADIPVIALDGLDSPDQEVRRALGARIDEANRHVGFLVVSDHGVPQRLIDDMHDVCEEFFALPEHLKQPVHQPAPETSRGWMEPHARSLAGKRTGDYVEYFAIGSPEAIGEGVFDHVNLWPAGQDRFRAVWTAYYRQMERVATTLLKGFALGLGLAEDWFDASCAKHCSVLFANGFPPVSDLAVPGSVRLGEHTDYGSLTILYRNERPSGLQVRQEGQWRLVPDIPGTFVVNIGDLMARWTDDRWVSTLHRVANPPAPSLGERRLSIPFFHQPDPDALIEAIPTCIGESGAKYPPITSGDNYLLKTRRSLAAA
ncbi:isopenicillin N synthase family dioxygenase [Raineyella sp. W15-4]|uniref:isopenicillin N synthase family dioxygenase n=1 Tax=Raineyella sp. W15-4 TaxID=3081651 RepID=UPI0029535719|nr:2-oxoglutarate and iron-dependent oxygenase domain-containing protein [Raineyella sp. W15-4]WOQ17029.1 2-oxoglutarate and iron-dependent oxygenase domain-containing protein [Raineyella sp. W15-4]